MTDATNAPPILESARPARALHWFLSAYLQLFIGGVLDAAGELLLKKGAISPVAATGLLHWLAATFHQAPLGSGWTWLGIASYIGGLLCWLYVLRTIPLSIAFPVISVIHMLVPVGARVLLHEQVHLQRWLGIIIALAGMMMILRPVARAEEKL